MVDVHRLKLAVLGAIMSFTLVVMGDFAADRETTRLIEVWERVHQKDLVPLLILRALMAFSILCEGLFGSNRNQKLFRAAVLIAALSDPITAVVMSLYSDRLASFQVGIVFRHIRSLLSEKGRPAVEDPTLEYLMSLLPYVRLLEPVAGVFLGLQYIAAE